MNITSRYSVCRYTNDHYGNGGGGMVREVSEGGDGRKAGERGRHMRVKQRGKLKK